MPRKNNRQGTSCRAMSLNMISERVGVPVAQPKPIIRAHLPEPDEPEPVESNGIRTRRGVWDDIRPGRVRCCYDGRGK